MMESELRARARALAADLRQLAGTPRRDVIEAELKAARARVVNEAAALKKLDAEAWMLEQSEKHAKYMEMVRRLLAAQGKGRMTPASLKSDLAEAELVVLPGTKMLVPLEEAERAMAAREQALKALAST